MGVCISISVWVGLGVELPGRLLGNARRREEDFIARRQFSSVSDRRHCCLARPLRQARAVLCADDFGHAFAKHCERWDKHPEPPNAACWCEEEGTERDQQKTNPHEYLCYSTCESGWAAVFEVALAVAVSPSA